jgi:cysteinyl-tRNA synthetase, unknown class
MLISSAASLRLLAFSAAMALSAALNADTARSQDHSPAAPDAGPAEAAAAPPPTIRSWGYQLQAPDPATLKNVPYDAIVIDYSRDGSEKSALSAAEVRQLKVKPDGSPRLVLAYMSIGEAENYRFYWQRQWDDDQQPPETMDKPSWRGKQNGEWGGNYAVHYWDPDWQNIIIGDSGYVDRILKAGFDGVWLDKVDSSVEDVAAGRPSAKADMVEFVKRIAERARRVKPDFRVFPQNGEELLSDAVYRAMIDGIGKEGLLYGNDGPDKANSTADIAETAELLRLLVAEGKPVLAVEYLNNPADIDAARAKISGYGFVPHFTDRSLSSMRIGDYAGPTPTPDFSQAIASWGVGPLKPTHQAASIRPGSNLVLLQAAAALMLALGLMWRIAARR